MRKRTAYVIREHFSMVREKRGFQPTQKLEGLIMDEPDEMQYETSVEDNMAIMRAVNEILFMEKMKKLMPLVAQELVKAGVDFSKVRTDEN